MTPSEGLCSLPQLIERADLLEGDDGETRNFPLKVPVHTREHSTYQGPLLRKIGRGESSLEGDCFGQ